MEQDTHLPTEQIPPRPPDVEEALRESEERFRVVASSTYDFICEASPDGRFVYLSPNYSALLGYEDSELLGRSVSEFVHPDDLASVMAEFQNAFATMTSGRMIYRYLHKNGEWRWLESTGKTYRSRSGEPRGVIISRDITERKRVEEALVAQARQQAVLAEFGRDALTGASLPALMERAVSLVARTLDVEYCNVAAILPDGTGLRLLAGMGWREGLVGHVMLGADADSPAGSVLVSKCPVVFEDFPSETRWSGDTLLREHGIVSGVSVVVPGGEEPFGVLGAFTARRRRFTDQEVHFLQVVADLLAAAIEHRRAETIIKHQAYHDSLTDLPNRLVIEDRLALAVSRAHRTHRPLAVLILDLDRFKNVNDTLGHSIGDLLLQSVAERLTSCVSEDTLVARMGGDEFALLLPEVGTGDDVTGVAERILLALRPAFHLSGYELHITASIGSALYPEAGYDAQTLLSHADTALYRAKERGGDTVRQYSPIMNAKALDRLALENILRRALERREFLLHFQPQVDLKSSRIVGFEALVRWRRPEGGVVPPADFIPLAEETGLIVPIGEWVLRNACLQAKAWQDAGFPPVRIGVNLSVRQLQRRDWAETVTRVLTETGLPADCLELELTESILMQKEESVLTMFRTLAATGVRFAIDDFGTGYSSLSYLKRFPVCQLKIDQSFVRDITTDRSDAVIAKTIIGMAHSLRFTAIAEGVETPGQLERLRLLRCDEIQGHIISPPIPAEEATRFLSQGTNWSRPQSRAA